MNDRLFKFIGIGQSRSWVQSMLCTHYMCKSQSLMQQNAVLEMLMVRFTAEKSVQLCRAVKSSYSSVFLSK